MKNFTITYNIITCNNKLKLIKKIEDFDNKDVLLAKYKTILINLDNINIFNLDFYYTKPT